MTLFFNNDKQVVKGLKRGQTWPTTAHKKAVIELGKDNARIKSVHDLVQLTQVVLQIPDQDIRRRDLWDNVTVFDIPFVTPRVKREEVSCKYCGEVKLWADMRNKTLCLNCAHIEDRIRNVPVSAVANILIANLTLTELVSLIRDLEVAQQGANCG